ncbi:hypothetical protein HPB49_011796 [Dermacentor silvarum]|uniref:Uncharacterized protein n=1 Tax=Dermacentor silvarum TaxID=543639 RepID=A0ACB8DP91_DERSI|nr:hypothetical protein HPB49_011796 [Dermacentor silvarum]
MPESARSEAKREDRSEQQQLLVKAATKAPLTPGPYRCASKPGTFITMFPVAGIRDKLRSFSKYGSVEETIESGTATIGGYTFGIQCKLRKDDADVVSAFFVLFLSSGEWDDYLDWPFAKELTVILAHTEDQEKDIRLPLCFDDDCDFVKKPAPDCCNRGHQSKPVSLEEIESRGLICNNTLYVNVELE